MQMKEDIIGTLFLESSMKFAHKEMIHDVTLDRTCTYAEFKELVDSISKGLIAEGLKKGDYVGILAPNSTYWLAIFYAVCNIGGVAVLLNAALAIEEIAYAINYSEVQMLFTTEELLEKIEGASIDFVYQAFLMDNEEAGKANINFLIKKGENISDKKIQCMMEDVRGDDPATIQFTSGTTGNAKAVLTSNASIYLNVKDTARELGYTENDKVLLGTPLYHILGYIGTALTVFSIGATLSLMLRFKTTVALETIEKDRCTCFHGVPTMYQFLIENCEDYDISCLDKGLIAGASVSREILKWSFLVLQMKSIVNIYGQTETLSIATIHYHGKHDADKVGFVLREGIVAKLVDSENRLIEETGVMGELIVETDNAMLGYYKNEEETRNTKNGKWIRTGDLAIMNIDGTIQLKGRKGDIIIRGGENILVTEIEKKIREHPLVREVAVFGVKDKVFGEEIAAFVEYYPDAKLNIIELKEFVCNRLGKVERPKYLRLVKYLPLNATGKINKNKLREMLL